MARNTLHGCSFRAQAVVVVTQPAYNCVNYVHREVATNVGKLLSDVCYLLRRHGCTHGASTDHKKAEISRILPIFLHYHITIQSMANLFEMGAVTLIKKSVLYTVYWKVNQW